ALFMVKEVSASSAVPPPAGCAFFPGAFCMRLPRLIWLTCVAILCLRPQALFSQEPAKATASDFSKEPFVVEQLSNHVQFESDGTSTIETEGTIRIQSAAGVQAWSVLQLPYASANSEATFANVRVKQADGNIVETQADLAQDIPAQITVAAPTYSDIKAK